MPWINTARLMATALALSLPLLSAADPVPMHAPAPTEFAMRLPLQVSGNNGVVQLTLPMLVYQQSQSASLADLRVYNDSGRALPYALYQPIYRARIESRESDTVQFPIYQSAQLNSGSRDLQLEWRTNRDGSLLSVQTRESSTLPADTLSALIIDLGPSAADEVLESLRFDLPESSHDYRTQVAIERSEDLKLWEGAAYGNLDWISAADDSRQLVNNRMDLPNGSGRYLKLRWIDGDSNPFAAIHARWRSASIKLPPTLEVELNASAGRVEGDFSYQASPAIVATALGLVLPEANTVLPVSIGFYRPQAQAKSPWRLLTQIDSTFYRLTKDGRERVSGRINIAPLSSSEWVVRPHTADHAAPKLILQWQPQTLAFNAQGSGFYLAVGAPPEVHTRWLGGPAPMAQVAPGFSQSEIEQLERAIPGTAIPTVSTQPLIAEAIEAPADPARLRLMVLWAALGLGILMLGLMSWRLYQQLSKSSSN